MVGSYLVSRCVRPWVKLMLEYPFKFLLAELKDKLVIIATDDHDTKASQEQCVEMFGVLHCRWQNYQQK